MRYTCNPKKVETGIEEKDHVRRICKLEKETSEADEIGRRRASRREGAQNVLPKGKKPADPDRRSSSTVRRVLGPVLKTVRD